MKCKLIVLLLMVSALPVFALPTTNVFDLSTNVSVVGQVWSTNATVIVGNTNDNNNLYIAEGGFVSNLATYVGYDSDYNGLIITNANSKLRSDGEIVIGAAGSENKMIISDGGYVTNDTAFVGRDATANNNKVLVDGAGWDLAGALNVGTTNSGGNSGNSVTVTNGGIISAETVEVASNNDFYLADGGWLRVKDLDADQNGGFHWNNGSVLVISGNLTGTDGISGTNKVLSLNDGAVWNTGALTLAGSTNELFLNAGSTVTSASVDFEGTNNLLSIESALTVTNDFNMSGLSNQLWVSSGARVDADSVTITNLTDSLVVVQGEGTTVNVADKLAFFAGNSVSNIVSFQNQANVINQSGVIGASSGSISNRLQVLGNGTVWRNTESLSILGTGNVVSVSGGGSLFVGDATTNDFSNGMVNGGVAVSSKEDATLTVSGGATLGASTLYVGVDTTSTGTVSVSDNGTVSVSALQIAKGSSFELDDGGTFEIYNVDKYFNAKMDGLNWNDGGHLKVDGGFLYGLDVENIKGDDYTQFTGENKTLTINAGGWANANNNIAIGSDGGSGNTLVVTNGGRVFSANGYVGYDGNSNSVVVTGAGSVWELLDTLYVGTNGLVGNTVTVKDAGTIQADALVVSSNNSFYLTKGGVLDIQGDLTFNDLAGLVWTNSGELKVAGELTWDGGLTNAEQTLTLNGGNAAWDHTGADLSIGTAGSSNTLNILNGAVVRNMGANIGTGINSDSNEVWVTGSGSRWTNSAVLTIGAVGTSNNSVTVSSGGTVQADSLTIVGDNEFNLNSGGELELFDTFDVAQAGLNWNANSTLIIHSNLTRLADIDGTNRTLVVEGGAVSSASDSLHWGHDGSGNKISVLSAGKMNTESAYVGYNEGADNNQITIGGDQSEWTNSTLMTIGFLGANNQLTISESGTVHSADAHIGVKKESTGNKVLVTGTNSEFLVSGNLLVGLLGGKNSVRIEDAGRVTNQSTTVGFTSDDNSLAVTGDNSLLRVSDLYVGAYAEVVEPVTITANGTTVTILTTNWVPTVGNTVSVGPGGRVETDYLKIYENNQFVLNNGGTLHIDASTFNVTNEWNAIDDRLLWNAGGNLSVSGELLGMATTNLPANGGTNTFGFLDGGRYLTLDGAGARWDYPTNALIVGYNSSNSKLMITSNASVTSTDGYIGWGSTAANNAVVVSGNDSTWTIDSNLYVGAYLDKNGKTNETGTGNALTVQSNGWVFVGDGDATDVVAYTNGGIAVASATGAELYVTKNANVLTEGALLVGLNSTRTGTVSVLNGGTITAETLVIADTNSAFNLNNKGVLKITGAFDSQLSGFNWNSGGHLSVGGSLSNNLTGLRGTNQTLTIDGGSWDLGTTSMEVGTTGGGNTLNIINGGKITNGDATVGSGTGRGGFNPKYEYNNVAVSGSNSIWNLQGALTIGDGDSNLKNNVTVQKKGTIQAQSLFINDQNSFTLADGGTLEMQSGFDVSATEHDGLDWQIGGNLAVRGGALSGMLTTNLVVAAGSTNTYSHLSGGKHLTLFDNGSWNAGGTANDLIIGYNSNSAQMTISTNGSVTSGDGFIGWGSGNNNSVLVEGANAEWDNNGNLYVGAYLGTDGTTNLTTRTRNSLTVSNSGWVVVGNFNTNSLGGGLGVVGTNVIGNGSVKATEGFYVGNTNLGQNGFVSVFKEGSVTTSDLDIRDGSSFNLDGALTMTGDFNADQIGFNWHDGASLNITNGALTLTEISGTDQLLVVNGATWTGGAFSMSGVENSVSIINSGQVSHASATIGLSENDWGNSVSISNSGSTWNVTGDLTVGSGGSYSNTLSVTDNGTLDIGGDFNLYNASTFTLSTNATVSVGANMTISSSKVLGAGTVEFSDLVDNTLSIYGSNTVIGPLVVFDGGTSTEDNVNITDWEFYVNSNVSTQFVNFENLTMTDATLGGSGTLNAFSNSITLNGGTIRPNDPNNELYLITDTLVLNNMPTLDVNVYTANVADELRVSGTLSASNLQADITIASGIANVDAMDAVILTADGGGLDNVFSTNVVFNEHYLLYTFDLTNTLYETKVKAVPVVGSDISSSMEYAGLQGVRSSFNSMKSTVHTRTKQLRRNLVATEPTPRSRYNASLEADGGTDDQPVGPEGPGDKNQIFGMNIWAEHFTAQGSYDQMGNSDGFSLNGYGTTFGFDRLLGDSLIAGVNYTYARSSASIEDGSSTDSETYWLAAYGEWFNKDGWFVDGLAGYGWSDYNSTRPANSYLGTSKYEGNDWGGYLDAGKYMHWKNWAAAPYVGVSYLSVTSEDHIETEVNGQDNSIFVAGQQNASLDTAIGLKLRNRFDTRWGRFQTAGYAEWSYDHINEDFSTTLKTENDVFHTSAIIPEPEMINTGVGVSWTADENYELGVGYDGRFNENYEEHIGTLMINVMF